MAKKEKKEWEVYVPYEETREGGEPESDEEFSCRSPEYRNITFSYVYERKTDFFAERITLDFDPTKREEIILVVVIYSSGDTFGTTYGNFEIVKGCSTLEEAKKLKSLIENDKYKTNETNYLPWKGYFESLEAVHIEVLPFIPKDKDRPINQFDILDFEE